MRLLPALIPLVESQYIFCDIGYRVGAERNQHGWMDRCNQQFLPHTRHCKPLHVGMIEKFQLKRRICSHYLRNISRVSFYFRP